MMEIVGLAKAGQNKLQILRSIHRGTVRKELKKVTTEAGILVQQGYNAGIQCRDNNKGRTQGYGSSSEHGARDARRRTVDKEAAGILVQQAYGETHDVIDFSQ